MNKYVDIGDEISLSEAVERVSEGLSASGVFFGHGTFNADDEAAWLVLAACGIPLDAETIPWNQQIDRLQAGAVQRLLEWRIKSSKPLAYVIVVGWFSGY